jgi:hypothetical protein
MRLVVLVDQFEEVFTLCGKEELREMLVRNLLYAAKVVRGQTLVILTMRADFYAKCAANADLAAAFSDHHCLVGPMTEDELHRAIERPTQLVGCEFESGLVDLLMQHVRRQPGALPLLQHALLELWKKREGRRLTVKAYQEIGKLEGALQRRADATLESLSERQRELCRQIFLRLTQPGEGTEDTKRRASMQELVSLSGTSSAEEDIVQKLTNASLLTTEGDLSEKSAFVEVAHEALIRSWPQLRKWIDADRAGLRTRTRLTESARDWKNAGDDPAYLYTGARLAVAKEWEASHPGELSTDETEFLVRGLEAQKQREASELEAAQRLARAEAARAEEAEERAREQERAARAEAERAAEAERVQRLEAERAKETEERRKEQVEAAQRLAEEQKRRAELSEQREKEQGESTNKLRRRALAAAGAAAIALILLAVSVLMWHAAQEQAKIAKEQALIAEQNFADAASYKALFEWQAVVDMMPLYEGEMNLWISSRPGQFSSQIVQEFHQDFPAFNLREKNFSPDAFSGAISENAKDESYPDIAFIGNYRELQPLLAAKVVWLDWGQKGRFENADGWWVIFKGAKHIDQARAFLRWLSRSPHWYPKRVKNTRLSEPQIQAIQRIAFEALHRILAGDAAGLDLLLDKDAARFRLPRVPESFELVDVKPLLTFGNARIAFVIVAAFGSGDELYGVSHWAFILRNDGGDWRTLYPGAVVLQQAEELFRTFDEKMTSDGKSPAPPKADLVGPRDKASFPRFPIGPTIEWTVASGTGLSFIVESQFGQPGDKESWSQSYLKFVDVPETQQAFAITAPFGVGAQPHRWRIWTLNQSGGISISDWREIDFTN